jgi:hypothetical protein
MQSDIGEYMTKKFVSTFIDNIALIDWTFLQNLNKALRSYVTSRNQEGGSWWHSKVKLLGFGSFLL